MTGDAALWSALPVPALLVDAHDRIARSNPAAESFLNTSSRAHTDGETCPPYAWCIPSTRPTVAKTVSPTSRSATSAPNASTTPIFW